MLINLLKWGLIFWGVYTIFNWYHRWRSAERRKAFEAGRRSAASPAADSKSSKKMNTDEIGDYVDYEEVK